MTTDEFRNEFNLLYNNIMSNKAPGLDDYEISLFLTKAQEDAIKEAYSKNFEGSEEVRRYLSKIVKSATISIPKISGVYQTNPSVTLDNKAWFLTYEECDIVINPTTTPETKSTAVVKPVTHDDLYDTERNPFRGPNKNRVLRYDLSKSVTSGQTTTITTVNLVSRFGIYSYTYFYIEKPDPIILSNLGTQQSHPLTIDGDWEAKTCQLDESIHRVIVNRAVMLAQTAYK